MCRWSDWTWMSVHVWDLTFLDLGKGFFYWFLFFFLYRKAPDFPIFLQKNVLSFIFPAAVPLEPGVTARFSSLGCEKRHFFGAKCKDVLQGWTGTTGHRIAVCLGLWWAVRGCGAATSDFHSTALIFPFKTGINYNPQAVWTTPVERFYLMKEWEFQ